VCFSTRPWTGSSIPMAVRLKGPDADGKRMTFNFIFDDVGETHVVKLENAVLHHRRRIRSQTRCNGAPDAALLVKLGIGKPASRTSSCPTTQGRGEPTQAAVVPVAARQADTRFPIVTP